MQDGWDIVLGKGTLGKPFFGDLLRFYLPKSYYDEAMTTLLILALCTLFFSTLALVTLIQEKSHTETVTVVLGVLGVCILVTLAMLIKILGDLI